MGLDVLSGIDGQWVALLALVTFATGAILVPAASLQTYLEYRRRSAAIPIASKRDHLLQEVERLRLDLEGLEARRAELVEALDGHDGLRAERAELEARADLARTELERLDERRKAMEADKEEIARVRAERDRLREEADAARETLNDLGRKKGDAEHALEELRKAHTAAEKTRTDFEKARDAAKRRADEAHDAAEKAERARTDAERRATEAGTKAETLEGEVRTLEERRGDLRSKVDALHNLKDTLEAWAAEQAKDDEDPGGRALGDLFEPPALLTTTSLTKAATLDDEAEALANLDGYLERVGLSFPSRRVHAFHTALKIAGISPLTVLAGISGTGKSELPRRYAEGMGLHFLQMAVQPRWDAPQDLFGFYNYLEKRFAATDLSRALLHLDGHNHPKHAKPYDGRMMLVLLDEMNLARVEYYFSEFLSRLEVRRSVDPSDPASRQQAEVTLDTGGGAKRESVRIFVGGNVLFVGTMNEDESTQTLSDKVNDRANVLRFGRPTTMRHATPDNTAVGAGAYLPYATWASWYRTADAYPTDARTQLHGWIHRVNDALARVGRPFGHRVSQAIETYVVNYPGSDRLDATKRAFADQIEQRILPKLRGLETDAADGDPLKEVRDVARDVDDDALADAIDTSLQNDVLFQWHGLDREDA